MANNNIAEDKFILILSIHTRSRKKILRVIPEHAQIPHYTMLLENWRQACLKVDDAG